MAGLPGSGKSTVAEALSAQLRVAVVSVDPLESAILRSGIDDDQPTGLAAYLVAETITEAVLRSGQGVIVDAVNAVAPARDQWVLLGQRLGAEVRFIETVCTDPEVYRRRLVERRRDLAHGGETSQHAVEQRLDEYDSWSGAADACPRIRLDTATELDLIIPEALAFLRS
jgi:predicted kinase